MGVHDASIPVGEPSARRQIGRRSLGHQRSLAAPPAALRNPSAHGRSPGSQRIADAAFPDLQKAQWREKRRHAAYSRGGGHGSTKSLPCSLFTLGRNRGTVRWSSSSLETGCQMEGRPPSGPAKKENLAADASELASARDPNIEERPARTSAGRSSSGLGSEPRGPNAVRSCHSAVILASGATGLRVRTEFSVSAERASAPNSISANRRSISCCRRASASSVGQREVRSEDAQNLALTAMRFEACTTAGAQTASEARPRRNCRRGATREPTVRIPRRS
jgi:hypothetical protein